MLVIKLGGGAGVDVENVLDDLAALDEEWVLVHGASDETNRLQERLGAPARFVTSVSGHVSRFTDAAALDALTMGAAVLNRRIVEGLQQRGVNAVGLTGVDGRLLEGKRKSTIKAVVDLRSDSEDRDGSAGGVTRKRVVLRGDHTGTVENVNAHLLRTLLDGGYRPVLTVPTISFEGEAVNADGDRAAAAVAGALDAQALLILSNVPGLLRDVDDATSLVTRVPVADLARAAEHAQGRFRKKILGAEEALARGVKRVVFAGSTGDAPVRRAASGEAGTHVYAPGGEPKVPPAS